ncbi:MAG: hypothetical protein Q9169_000588 [Polycauliona sp. 2 TL-2023]
MPSRLSKAKGKAKPEEEQRENSLQAVILADSYETRFQALSSERPRCLLPLANTPLIEYTLEFLAHVGAQDIFIFCGAHSDQVETYVNASKWRLPTSPFKSLVLFKTDAASAGDAMRDLDNRDLIKGDFLLVSGDVISNMAIEPALTRHLARRAKDKNAIMTMVLREAGVNHRAKANGHKPVFILNPTTDRCLHYEEARSSIPSGRHVTLEPDLLSMHSEIEVREDLIDCHIDICAPDVLGLWSDNFDYQSIRTGFLFGVLKDYELNGKTIHTHIMTEGYAARVRSLRAYDAVSKDIRGRWTYPLCPDSNHVPGHEYRYHRSGSYREKKVTMGERSRFRGRCVAGKGTAIGEGVSVSESCLGRNCQVGKNALIEGSYLWDNVIVGDDSIVRHAIVAEAAVIGKGCTVESGAMISCNLRISDDTTISGSKKFSQRSPASNAVAERANVPFNGGENQISESASDSDDYSEPSDASDRIFRNPQASVSGSSVSTLRSDDSEFEQSEDRSRRASIISEMSDDATPNRDFHIEATANVLDGLQKGDLPDNINLELTAFRMTVDASQHEIRRAVVAAFMKRVANLEASGTGAREAVHDVFSKYKSMVDRLLFDKGTQEKPDQVDFLLCVQREVLSRSNAESLLLFVAKETYDLELIEEDGILQWWPDIRSRHGKMASIRGLTEQFITFLQEAEEDDDDDDESEEDEDQA